MKVFCVALRKGTCDAECDAGEIDRGASVWLTMHARSFGASMQRVRSGASLPGRCAATRARMKREEACSRTMESPPRTTGTRTPRLPHRAADHLATQRCTWAKRKEYATSTPSGRRDDMHHQRKMRSGRTHGGGVARMKKETCTERGAEDTRRWTKSVSWSAERPLLEARANLSLMHRVRITHRGGAWPAHRKELKGRRAAGRRFPPRR